MNNKVRVQVIFYTYYDGGRKEIIRSGYRSGVLFGINKNQSLRKGRLGTNGISLSRLNSSGTFLNFSETPKFNANLTADLVFNNFNPEIRKYLKSNEYFIIFEAPRIIGRGKIL